MGRYSLLFLFSQVWILTIMTDMDNPPIEENGHAFRFCDIILVSTNSVQSGNITRDLFFTYILRLGHSDSSSKVMFRAAHRDSSRAKWDALTKGTIQQDRSCVSNKLFVLNSHLFCCLRCLYMSSDFKF